MRNRRMEAEMSRISSKFIGEDVEEIPSGEDVEEIPSRKDVLKDVLQIKILRIF